MTVRRWGMLGAIAGALGGVILANELGFPSWAVLLQGFAGAWLGEWWVERWVKG